MDRHEKRQIARCSRPTVHYFYHRRQNLRYQQNLTGNPLSIILLPTNQVPLVLTLLPDIRDTIMAIQPGELIEISLP